jgi:hypothetical protein
VTDRDHYTLGPTSGAEWQALINPAHLCECALYEADGSLVRLGTRVKLTTVGAPAPQVSCADTAPSEKSPESLNTQQYI